MMRHVESDSLGGLAEIYADDVELISISQPESPALAKLAGQLLESRQHLELEWQQDVHSTEVALPETSDVVEPAAMDALGKEVTFAVDVLHELLDCDRVGVRIATLRGPMCPRFHVDQIPCRMLVTFSGAGTEWIASDEVDREQFADRQNLEPPLRNGASIRQLPAGSWSLLKGGTWDDQFSGVVHRSPHGTSQRLLMSLDPIFSK